MIAALGAVLAGGASARMQTLVSDKAALVVDGETLGARAVAMLRVACVDGVVCLGHGRGIDASVERVADVAGVLGPVTGLLALLRSGRATRYVIVAVDMPDVHAADLVALALALDDAAGESTDAAKRGLAACFEDGSGLEPLPLIVDAEARVIVERLVDGGERRLTSIVAALHPTCVPLARRLGNLNAPTDLVR